MSNTPRADQLFPPQLSWRELFYKVVCHHVPFFEGKYERLEECRIEAVDNGESETLKDEWWTRAIETQKEWDALAESDPSAYEDAMDELLHGNIEAAIAHSTVESMIRHRSDKQYDLYDSAVKALEEYHVADKPYWLEKIAPLKEEEQEMRENVQSFRDQIKDIIDSTRLLP